MKQYSKMFLIILTLMAGLFVVVYIINRLLELPSLFWDIFELSMCALGIAFGISLIIGGKIQGKQNLDKENSTLETKSEEDLNNNKE